jgi:hypothetical protein
MKLYKRTFKGRSVAEVHQEVGRAGGLMIRLDQDGDVLTAYFEADDHGTDTKEASRDEITRT